MTATGQLADDLCRIGRRHGLDEIGVCDARPFTETRAVIEARKQAGQHAGMQFTYRNPARSTDPAATLPGARSLVVGLRSYRRAETAVRDGAAARVARYSWVDHYRPLRQALGAVADRLRAEGWRALVLADDNALVDRAAAVRAGLGWYGKNANVLVPGRGSWFVIGSVVTDAPIAPDHPAEPVPDGCGTCRRCMADCPTGALIGPGNLDARRCLAWLLQAPGPFPVEFRAALGDRIYGCDECQERCPVNRRADRVEAPAPAEPGAQAVLPVLEILAADDDRLEALVGRWYIPGREMRYVRRNALVVLGNTGDGSDPRVRATLARYLADADPILRSHALWAAGRLGLLSGDPGVGGPTQPVRRAAAALARDHDPEVRAEWGRWQP